MCRQPDSGLQSVGWEASSVFLLFISRTAKGWVVAIIVWKSWTWNRHKFVLRLALQGRLFTLEFLQSQGTTPGASFVPPLMMTAEVACSTTAQFLMMFGARF